MLFAWVIFGVMLYIIYLDQTRKPEKSPLELDIEASIDNAKNSMSKEDDDLYDIAENIATDLDDYAGDLSDGLNELIGGPADVEPDIMPPIKTVSPLTGEIIGDEYDNPSYQNPMDDSSINTPSVNEGSSFAPTGERPDTITRNVEELIMEQQRNAHVSIAMMDESDRNELSMLRGGYVASSTRPSGLQDFSRKLNPYGSDHIELERGLYPHTKPRYEGCYQDIIRYPTLPKSLGHMTVEQCSAASSLQGHKVFGMQYGEGTGGGRGECRTGNDNGFGKYGAAYDCTLHGDRLLGGWDTNAVYTN
jgi:hypothetical protein